MTKPRKATKATRKAKEADQPKASNNVPDISKWAQELIQDLSPHIPAEEAAIFAAQAEALCRRTPAPSSVPRDPTKPLIVKDRVALQTLATSMTAASDVVLDLETSDLDPRKGVIVGIGLAVGDATYYIPLNHLFENSTLRPGQLTLLDVVSVLPLQDKPLVNHNVKFEIRWLRHHTKVKCRFAWDTMIAARLLRPDLPADLEKLAVRELDVPEWDLPKADKKRIQYLPIERVAAYCAKDCRYTLQLYRRQRQCLN